MSLAGLLEDDQKEEEREYVFWCKVTQEELDRLLTIKTRTHFIDAFFYKMADKTRIRATDKEDPIFTVKTKNGEDDGSLEDNNPIPKKAAMCMLKYAENVHRVTRINIPVTNQGEPLMRKSGEQFMWEVDLFYVAAKGYEVLNWVKVELEVDKFLTDRVKEVIPFEYLEIIDEEEKLDSDRATVDNIWNKLANVASN